MSDSLCDAAGVLASSAKKQHARGWKKPAGKPKRPLSAYNIFFQLERDRIVNDEAEKLFTRADVAKVRVVAVADMPKRKDRKIHGKIAFVDLARSIGLKWKSLPNEEKEVFYERARLEKERYRLKVASWLQSRDKTMTEAIVDNGDDTGKAIAKSDPMKKMVTLDTLDSYKLNVDPTFGGMQLVVPEDIKELQVVDSEYDEWSTAAEIYGYQTQTDPMCSTGNDKVPTSSSGQNYPVSKARRVSLDAKSVFEMAMTPNDALAVKMAQRRTDSQYPLFIEDHDDVSLFDDDVLKNFDMVEEANEYCPEYCSMNGSHPLPKVAKYVDCKASPVVHSMPSWQTNNCFAVKPTFPRLNCIPEIASDIYGMAPNAVQPIALLDDEDHFVNNGSLAPPHFDPSRNRMMSRILSPRSQNFIRNQRNVTAYGWNRSSSQRTLLSRAAMSRSRSNRNELMSRFLMDRADYYDQIVAQTNLLAQSMPEPPNVGSLHSCDPNLEERFRYCYDDEENF